MGDEEARKLSVCQDDGELLLETVMTEKGYRKSLETGQLWTLHSATGRLLPLGGGVGFLSLTETGDGLKAIIDAKAARTLIEAGMTHAARTARASQGPDILPKWEEPDPKFHTAGGNNATADSPSGSGASGGEQGATSIFSELGILESTIAERRSDEKTDGSYTAYLFSQGEQKIRKKLGEEAIELCLAHEDDRVISESADLLYHLAVLLASRGLSYTDVLAELKRRRES